MRVKTVFATLLMAGLGLGLSACYVAPGPGYYDSGYYGSGYYGAPAYYGPAYYGYYGPSVGVYYGGRWGGSWDRDRRWR
jgi:hypothetical protein